MILKSTLGKFCVGFLLGIIIVSAIIAGFLYRKSVELGDTQITFTKGIWLQVSPHIGKTKPCSKRVVVRSINWNYRVGIIQWCENSTFFELLYKNSQIEGTLVANNAEFSVIQNTDNQYCFINKNLMLHVQIDKQFGKLKRRTAEGIFREILIAKKN